MAARCSIHQDVTEQIIAQLEAGIAPWVQPWTSGSAAGMPVNAATGRSYSGINVLLLWAAAARHNRTTQTWLTFRQALSLGGHVRKGERGVAIVYADAFVPRDDQASTAIDERQPVRFLKRHTVFHTDQCDNLPTAVEGKPMPVSCVLEHVETVISATGAVIRVGGDEAYYAPGSDHIQLPPQTAFVQPLDYYRTALHELTHWTGHKSRLNRGFGEGWTKEAYAREELVAELGAAFLCAELQVEPSLRHADYLGAWLKVLREDHRAIFRASSLASAAARFIMSFSIEPSGAAGEEGAA